MYRLHFSTPAYDDSDHSHYRHAKQEHHYDSIQSTQAPYDASLAFAHHHATTAQPSAYEAYSYDNEFPSRYANSDAAPPPTHADEPGLYYEHSSDPVSPASYASRADLASPLDAEARSGFHPPSQLADLQMQQHSYGGHGNQMFPMMPLHDVATQQHAHPANGAVPEYKQEFEESHIQWPDEYDGSAPYAEAGGSEDFPDIKPYIAHDDVYMDSPYTQYGEPMYAESPMSPQDSIASSYDSHDLSVFGQGQHEFFPHEEQLPYQPQRSYTLAAAITPLPGESYAAPRPPSPAPVARLASPSLPVPAEPARRPRGRPRKRPHAASRNDSPPPPVAYPFPQLHPHPHASTSSSHARAPSPVMHSLSPPEAEPQPMSLDEIPVHDREGKPGQAIFKLTAANAVKEPAKKKPVMACLFCRERKIACGPPVPGHADQRCNQCARRELKCEYPKESRRGQHKRGPRAMRMQALTEAALAPHPPGASASASVPVPGSASGSAPPKVRAGKERGRSESSSQRAVNRVAQRKTAVLQKERAAGGGGIPASM